MVTDDSGLTKDVAEHLGYFVVYLNRGDYESAAIHDRMARCALWSEVAKRLSTATRGVQLAAMQALQEPAP